MCGASLIVSIVNSRSKARALAVGYTVFFFFSEGHVLNKQLDGRIYLLGYLLDSLWLLRKELSFGVHSPSLPIYNNTEGNMREEEPEIL